MKQAGYPAAAAVACVVLLAACDGQAPKSCSTPTRSASASPSTSVPGSPAPEVSGPLTDTELAWVQAAEDLDERLKLAQSRDTGNSELTKESAQKRARALSMCSPGLAKLDPAPSARVAATHTAFQEVCSLYDRQAGCYTTIADYSGKLLSTSEARKVSEAGDCLSVASNEIATKSLALSQQFTTLKQLWG